MKDENFLNSLPEEVKLELYSPFDGERQVYVDGRFLSPKLSQHLVNHSPTGFNWGYGGSGPSQLALAILLEFMSYHKALQYYMAFKFNVVQTWEVQLPANPEEPKLITLNLREVMTEITREM